MKIKSKLTALFYFMTFFTQLSANEPYYIVDDIEGVDTVNLGIDIQEIVAGNTGEVISDIRDNDYVNYEPLKYRSDYVLVGKDAGFENSAKLSLDTHVLSLDEALVESDNCAIPKLDLPYSACIRYFVCKANSSQGKCKQQYALVYEKREDDNDILVHAGKYYLTAAVKEGATFEAGLGKTTFVKVLDKSHKVSSLATGYNSTHAFLILSNKKAIGRGFNTDNQINYDAGYDFENGNFGYPHKYLQRRATVQNPYGGYDSKYYCTKSKFSKESPTEWVAIHTFALDDAADRGLYNGTIAIDQAGDAYSWGKYSGHKFGYGFIFSNSNDTIIGCPRPVSRLSGTSLVKVVSGQRHALGLNAAGKLYSWGRDTGAMPDSDRLPSPVLASETFSDIAAGKSFSVLLTQQGIVKTLGDNSFGALGRNSASKIDVVRFVDDLGTPDDSSDDYTPSRMTKISANVKNAMAIDESGYIWIWGNEFRGQTNVIHHKPVRIKLDNGKYLQALKDTDDVYAGPHYQIVQIGGLLYGWGSNKNKVLGDKVPESGSGTPVIIFDAGNYQ